MTDCKTSKNLLLIVNTQNFCDYDRTCPIDILYHVLFYVGNTYPSEVERRGVVGSRRMGGGGKNNFLLSSFCTFDNKTLFMTEK